MGNLRNYLDTGNIKMVTDKKKKKKKKKEGMVTIIETGNMKIHSCVCSIFLIYFVSHFCRFLTSITNIQIFILFFLQCTLTFADVFP